MFFSPVAYDEPLFRPPAEAYSAIVQVSLGCSWNRCAFCDMYTSKQFKVRELQDVIKDIKALAQHYRGQVKKVFLADGNAMVLSAARMMPVLEAVNQHFSNLQRISAYASPRDILSKSDQELREMRAMGLKLLYVGLETGDDELLRLINKGETFQSSLDGVLKAQQAGIETSIMIINGLGGRQYAQQHAEQSAALVSKINPRFLSTLTLSLPWGESHYQKRFEGHYQPQSLVELMQELRLFIARLDLQQVIYRSNHVSNNLILAGTLCKDQQALLETIDMAIERTPANVFPDCPGML